MGIREVAFDGYTDHVDMIPYTLNNSGVHDMYYIPIGTYTIIIQPALSILLLNHTPCQHTLSTHSRNTPSQPSQYTLSIHPLNPPSQLPPPPPHTHDRPSGQRGTHPSSTSGFLSRRLQCPYGAHNGHRSTHPLRHRLYQVTLSHSPPPCPSSLSCPPFVMSLLQHHILPRKTDLPSSTHFDFIYSTNSPSPFTTHHSPLTIHHSPLTLYYLSNYLTTQNRSST